MENISMNSIVEVSGSNLMVSGSLWDWYRYYPTIEYWYPVYYPVYYEIYKSQPNKFELAFKIVSKLLEKKIIKGVTVKEFIELVNEVATII